MATEEKAEPETPRASTLLEPGTVIEGRYRIEALLGSGGMAAVYRATHLALEQPVAIKVVSPQVRAVAGMAQRFLREARGATQMKSAHVARVFDVGTMPDGAPYMVMEYLAGRDLDVVIETREVVPIEDAVDWVLQACEALAEVHGLGIVHRDLKPANLFLTRGNDDLACVKLIDFGISRFDTPLSEKDSAKLTTPDVVMGSPRYMAPEQMESASNADARSDIYGLGAILYELLTHRAPHDGESLLDIYAHVTQIEPPAPSSLRADIAPALDDVILRALRVAPSERFDDVAALAHALAPFGPEGSLARADRIGRVLEASRSRGREAGHSEPSMTGPEASSHVRRRIPPNARDRRRERVRRGSIAAAVVAIGSLALGARAVIAHGPPQPAAEPAPAGAPSAVAETNGAEIEAVPLAIPPAIKTIAPRSMPDASVPRMSPAPPAVAAPPPAAATAPPPPASPSASSPPTSHDERTLFEDRK